MIEVRRVGNGSKMPPREGQPTATLTARIGRLSAVARTVSERNHIAARVRAASDSMLRLAPQSAAGSPTTARDFLSRYPSKPGGSDFSPPSSSFFPLPSGGVAGDPASLATVAG